MSEILTSDEQIIAQWGESFRAFLQNPKIHFADDVITVDLKKPVKGLDGQEHGSLNLTEPTAGQIRAMDAVKGEIGKTVILLATVANIPEKSANSLSGADFTLLGGILGAFLGNGPETGTTA